MKEICHLSVYNTGFIGNGKYKAKIGGKSEKLYAIWHSMMERCYSEKYHIKMPTYKDCTIDERWHNFQVFAIWFEENCVEGWHLDKDILIKGNKIYSPETCCFVPHEINIVFTKRQNKRGDYPIGVVYIKKLDKFLARINKDNKKIPLGYFITPEEAFIAYKEAKELHIKELAEKYRDKITEQTYQALINYKVEIND